MLVSVVEPRLSLRTGVGPIALSLSLTALTIWSDAGCQIVLPHLAHHPGVDSWQVFFFFGPSLMPCGIVKRLELSAVTVQS